MMGATRNMPTRAGVFHYWRMKGKFAGANKFTCFSCASETEDIQRAHIIPKCKGGGDNAGNIHLLCPLCHRVTEYHLGPDDRSRVKRLRDYSRFVRRKDPMKFYEALFGSVNLTSGTESEQSAENG